GQPWVDAERRILRDLGNNHRLPDAYRQIHRYLNLDEYSYYSDLNLKGVPACGYRYDHVFASPELGAKTFAYLHHLRKKTKTDENGLSDHSAAEVVFEPSAKTQP